MLEPRRERVQKHPPHPFDVFLLSYFDNTLPFFVRRNTKLDDVFDPTSDRAFLKGLYIKPFLHAIEILFDFQSVNPPPQTKDTVGYMPLELFAFLVNKVVAKEQKTAIYSIKQIKFCLSHLPKALPDKLQGFRVFRVGRGQKYVVACPVNLSQGIAQLNKSASRFLNLPLSKTHLLIRPFSELPPPVQDSYWIRMKKVYRRRYPLLYWDMPTKNSL